MVWWLAPLPHKKKVLGSKIAADVSEACMFSMYLHGFLPKEPIE